MFDTAIFYCTWILVFIVCYYFSDLQFRYCIPVTILFLKFLYAILLLLLIRLYYLMRFEQQSINWQGIIADVVEVFNTTYTNFN